MGYLTLLTPGSRSTASMVQLNLQRRHKPSIEYGFSSSCRFLSLFFQYAGGECTLRYGLKREVRDKPVADGVDISLLLMQLWLPSDTLLNTRMVISSGFRLL